MSINAGNVYSELILDSSKYEKALDNAEKQADIFSGNLAKIGGAIAAAFSVKAIIDFGEKIIEASASIQAMEAQFDQVFKTDNAQAIEGITKQVDDLGIHADRLKEQWNAFGGMFKGFGIESENALNMTDRATRLAADAAAYYDKSLNTTAGSLKSFLMGNLMAGDAIGVNYNAKMRDIDANAKYGASWADLTQEQQQFLMLDVVERIYEQNGAMGQASRESDAYENVMGNLRATWQRLYATIGEPVLEQFLIVAQKATDKAVDLTEKIQNGESIFNRFGDAINFAKENSDIIIPVLGGVTAAITAQMIVSKVAVAMETYKKITEGTTIAQGILNVVMKANPFGLVAVVIGALVTAGIALYKNWDTVKAKAIELSDKVSNAWSNMKIAVLNAINGLIDKVQEFIGWIPAVNNALDSLKGKINNVVDEEKQVQQTRYLKNAYQARAEAYRNSLNQMEEDTQSTSDVIETTTTDTSNYVSSTVGSAGRSVKETSKSVLDTVSDHLDGISTKVNNSVSIIEKKLELWRLQNNQTEESSEYLTKQIEVQAEKQSLLSMQIGETELALAKIIAKYGEGSNEALNYKNALLDLQIQQEQLTDKIESANGQLEKQIGLIIEANGISINGPGGKVAVGGGNSSSNKRKKKDMEEHGDEINAISDRQGVDLSTAYDMWETNEREKIFGRVPQYASGTDFHRGGLAWVGEQGPELVGLPRGSKVYTNEKSMEMTRATSQTNKTEVHLHIGTLIADNNGLTQLERKLRDIRVNENARLGGV